MKQFNTVGNSFALILLLIGFITTSGCVEAVKRSPQDRAQLFQRRDEYGKRNSTEISQIFVTLLERAKAKQDDFTAGRRPDAPVIDMLIVSGGGDWGAFGSGFLKGWSKLPKSNPMAMPQFDIVTGVSTGALIAPFAFIGDDESLEKIDQLYRNPQKDWVKQRWPLYFLPNNLSFAEVPGLERELKKSVTIDMAARIAAAGKDGRILSVNTTNLDDASPRVFQLVPEAQRAVASGDMDRLHNIMLASAGIPGAFPYREIDGEMYVDGGITSNILYGGRLGEEDTLPAAWQARYPNSPIPKIRYWVIFNNHIQTQPAVVNARWPEIITRSLELSTRSASLTAMRHLFAMAEISRLKRKADVEIRIVAVPGEWSPPVPGIFIKETMNNLADVGQRMGADPASWSTQSPP